MKNKIHALSALTVPLLMSGPLQAASAVTSIDVIIGGSTVTFTNGTTDGQANDDQTPASAVLQTITSGGFIYSNFIGADGFTDGATGGPGDVEGVLFAVGGSAGTVSDVFGDLDLATGSLDPYGTGAVAGPEFFDFSSQTIAIDTTFFLFENETGPGNVALVDSTGADISTALSFNDDLGGEVQLVDFAYERTNGGAIGNREIFGSVFNVSDFTLNADSSLTDIAGFRASGGQL